VDRERLRAAINRMGLTEQAFLKIARAEQTRNQLAVALTAGVSAPQSLIDRLAKRRFEERVAEVVSVADTAVPAPAVPTDSQIETFYKANTKLFMAPEYRALTVLLLRPSDVDAQVQISDDDIAGAYDQRAAEFNIPEKRQASQLLLTSQEQADKAAQLVKAGRDISDIAKELKIQAIDLGTVSQAELPAELADPIFQAPQGTTVGPVKSDLGWHVIKVSSITKGNVKKLEDVKAQVVADLRRQKDMDALSTLSSKVDDALGGGASLEDAANTFGLKLVKLAGVDQKGMDANSRPAADLPKGANLLDVAFHTDQGTESQMTENGADGYFLVRVDSVTAPAPRPLAAVKTTVASTLAAENRHASAKQKAEALAESLKTGTPVSAIDKAPGITVKTTAAFTRDGGHADDLPPALVGQLFDKAVGDVAVADASTGWVVARLAAVKPVDLAQRPDAVKTIATSLSQSVASDLSDELLAGLNAQIGVKIDRSQLSREE
jgi:peptidyl-prolyl cis-trans isomerase D